MSEPAVARKPLQRASEQENDSCKNRKLNITGNYKGVLFTDKDQKEGTPATINVTGSRFELLSNTLRGTGLVSAVNNCGDTSIALKFTQVSGDEEQVVEHLKTGVSMDARVAAGGGEWRASAMMVDKPVVLATSRDRLGKLAGADLAFVICPPYPKCKRYPTCPCPEP